MCSVKVVRQFFFAVIRHNGIFNVSELNLARQRGICCSLIHL